MVKDELFYWLRLLKSILVIATVFVLCILGFAVLVTLFTTDPGTVRLDIRY